MCQVHYYVTPYTRIQFIWIYSLQKLKEGPLGQSKKMELEMYFYLSAVFWLVEHYNVCSLI